MQGSLWQQRAYLIIGVVDYIVGLNEPARKPEVYS